MQIKKVHTIQAGGSNNYSNYKINLQAIPYVFGWFFYKETFTNSEINNIVFPFTVDSKAKWWLNDVTVNWEKVYLYMSVSLIKCPASGWGSATIYL